jgi:hypothetical protein
MSFLKRLFGGGPKSGTAGAPEQAGDAVEHNGFLIRATPFREEGQFQTCGVISREIAGAVREHRFIRAERFASAEEAAAHALRKGRQLVDEQGERMFG